MTSFRHRFIITLLVLFLLLPHQAFAQEATLTNIIVTNTRDDLLVYLAVEGAFTEKMKEAILSGVPATFSFFIQIYQARNFWLDKKISDLEISHTIKYDTLKKEFEIRRSWQNDKPLTTKSFAEARKLMAEIDSLKIVSLSKLEKGRQYQLRAKAELSKLTLPYYLHYILFFVSLWDFETDWYTIDFIF
jgi:hypothetical protein